MLGILALVVVGGSLYIQRPIKDIAMESKTTPEPTPVPTETPITGVVEVVLKTTKGEITLALDATRAPHTVENFVKLAQANFYDGTTFHRVIPNFMIQGGDPKGDGTGGPGYTFPDEINAQSLPLVRGVIAMANSGPNTNGSQFFIITAPETAYLNGKHTPFGVVKAGMDVVDAISHVKTGPNDKPIEPVVIQDVVVRPNPLQTL